MSRSWRRQSRWASRRRIHDRGVRHPGVRRRILWRLRGGLVTLRQSASQPGKLRQRGLEIHASQPRAAAGYLGACATVGRGERGAAAGQSLGTMAEQIAELGDRMGIFAKIPRPIDLRYVGSPGGWPTGTRPRGRQLQPAGPGRRVVGRRGLLVPAPGRPVPPPVRSAGTELAHQWRRVAVPLRRSFWNGALDGGEILGGELQF